MEKLEVKVFIIEDDIDMQKLYNQYFKLNGINVIGNAYNGIEALKMLKNSMPKPDYIIIDYRMPIMDGIEVTKQVLGHRRTESTKRYTFKSKYLCRVYETAPLYEI